jgi:hypothetical protein
VKSTAALLLLLSLAACGKSEPAGDPLETEAYKQWKAGQMLRQLPAANFATTTPGRVEIFPPESRSKNAGDFCELYVNGERVGRFNVGRRPDGSWPENSFAFTFLTGPNTFDLWDSTSNRYYREHVDTRQCVHFQCVPTAEGYEVKWVDRKVPDLDK